MGIRLCMTPECATNGSRLDDDVRRGSQPGGRDGRDGEPCPQSVAGIGLGGSCDADAGDDPVAEAERAYQQRGDPQRDTADLVPRRRRCRRILR